MKAGPSKEKLKYALNLLKKELSIIYSPIKIIGIWISRYNHEQHQ
jgi:hypothetical protein